jgi:hypothetical protein
MTTKTKTNKIQSYEEEKSLINQGKKNMFFNETY